MYSNTMPISLKKCVRYKNGNLRMTYQKKLLLTGYLVPTLNYHLYYNSEKN